MKAAGPRELCCQRTWRWGWSSHALRRADISQHAPHTHEAALRLSRRCQAHPRRAWPAAAVMRIARRALQGLGVGTRCAG